jgi:hypothetical protein
MDTPINPIDQPLIDMGRSALARHVIGIAARGSGATLITATDRVEIVQEGRILSTTPHGTPDVHDVSFDPFGNAYMHTFTHFAGAVPGVKIARAVTDEPAILLPFGYDGVLEISEAPKKTPGDAHRQLAIRQICVSKSEAIGVAIEALDVPGHRLIGPISAFVSGFVLSAHGYESTVCLASSTSIIVIDIHKRISTTHKTPLPFVSFTRTTTDGRHDPPVLCIAATGEIYGFSPDALDVAFVPIMRLAGDFSHAKFLDQAGNSHRSTLLLVQRPDEKAILYDIDVIGRTALRMQADGYERWDAAVRGWSGRLFVCAHTVGAVVHDLHVTSYQIGRAAKEEIRFSPDENRCISLYSDGLLVRDGEPVERITAYTRVVRGNGGRVTRSTKGSTCLTIHFPDMTIDFGDAAYAEDWHRRVSGFIEEQKTKQ